MLCLVIVSSSFEELKLGESLNFQFQVIDEHFNWKLRSELAIESPEVSIILSYQFPPKRADKQAVQAIEA